MTKHTLRLHPEPFDEIVMGSKTIELRLYDEKRQHINVGDELIFIDRRNTKNIVTTKVISLIRAKNFHELLSNNAILQKSGPNARWLEEQLAVFYSLDDQQAYGVIGIEFILTKQN